MKKSTRKDALKADLPTEKKPIGKGKASAVLGIISAVLLILTAVGLYFSRHYLADPSRIRELVGHHYILGALCLVFLCVIQVVVALIPSEMLEIAAGYIFGAWWGALLCTIGVALGSALTIFLVRKLGSKFVYALYPKEKIDALPILNNPRKRNSLVLILFLIPGTPKDLLTYGIGLTDMSITTYLLLTTASRFPSVITSTMGGNAMGEKQYLDAIIIFSVTVVISVTGLLIYNYVIKKHQKKGKDPVPAPEQTHAANGILSGGDELPGESIPSVGGAHPKLHAKKAASAKYRTRHRLRYGRYGRAGYAGRCGRTGRACKPGYFRVTAKRRDK